MLRASLAPELSIAVAWGATVATLARSLSPGVVPGLQIIQMSGAGNTFSSGAEYAAGTLGRFGAAFGARVHHFPVPAFFDKASAREALWNERSVQRVLRLQERANLAVFSVSALDSRIPGHLYRAGLSAARRSAATGRPRRRRRTGHGVPARRRLQRLDPAQRPLERAAHRDAQTHPAAALRRRRRDQGVDHQGRAVGRRGHRPGRRRCSRRADGGRTCSQMPGLPRDSRNAEPASTDTAVPARARTARKRSHILATSGAHSRGERIFTIAATRHDVIRDTAVEMPSHGASKLGEHALLPAVVQVSD